MGKILVAGATGMLGRHVTARLKNAGFNARVLVRQAQDLGVEQHRGDLLKPESLHGSCEGVETVISCAGASMSLRRRPGSPGFQDVDHAGNRNLLVEAQRSGVRKFVYVSLAKGRQMMHTEYARSHELFVDELAASRIAYTVVRPTGFFGFMAEILRMARRGRVLVVGDGAARTNPIHEDDVARACVEAIATSIRDMPVGGPDFLTRIQIAKLAFHVLGREPRITHVPPWLAGAMLPAFRLADGRRYALYRFGKEVSSTDVIAPRYGEQRLKDYFRQLATEGRSAAADGG